MEIRHFVLAGLATGLFACAMPTETGDLEDEAAVGEAEQESFFVEDLKVTKVSSSYSTVTVGGGKSTSVTFRIENVGGLDVSNFPINYSTHAYRSSDGAERATTGRAFASLIVGAHIDYTVNCSGTSGYYCDSTHLEAVLASDDTPDNNGLTVAFIWDLDPQ